jgi:Cdc6-like AAA superfamily ATPase
VSWFEKWTLGRRRSKARPGSGGLQFRSADPVPLLPLRPRPTPGSDASSLPHFHATAGDQVDSRFASGAASARIRLRNAFTPAQPITEQRMFAGRREILTTLIRSIEDERLHVILYGERGIGKTSLLHVLAQAARDARYLVAYVSCGASSSFDEIFRTIAAEIPLMFHKDHGPTTAEAEHGGAFIELLGEGAVSPREASDLCAKVVDTRLLVVLDEFDRCENLNFRSDIAEFLKNLSDRSMRVQLVIAGVADNLAELIQYRLTINRNILAVEAPRMAPTEIAELVDRGEAASGLRFDANARDMIVTVANGMPYAASLLSQHAGLTALSDNRSMVIDDDVSAALAEALFEIHGRLSRRAQFQLRTLIQGGGHRLLGQIAGSAQFSGRRFTEADIARSFPAAQTSANCQALVRSLAAEGLLIEAVHDEFGDHYRFLEENVTIYLWFLASQARFIANGSHKPEPGAATAEAKT